MTSVRLDLGYHGAGFAGWAAQPGKRTVQGELEAALERVLQREIRLTVAGRTDSGVHAWGQVASFDLDADPPDDLVRALNGLTGDDLAVHSVTSVPGGFDARRDALSRTYCFRVQAARVPSPFERGLSLHWPYPVDRGALNECAGLVAGTHDFTAFTPAETEHVRFERDVFRCEWRDRPLGLAAPAEPEAGAAAPPPEGSILEMWIEADAFMRNMVRALAGTMLEVAGGRRTVEDFASLLEGAPRERGGATAAAHGLHLAAVSY